MDRKLGRATAVALRRQWLRHSMVAGIGCRRQYFIRIIAL
jgi:hypothetical protein